MRQRSVFMPELYLWVMESKVSCLVGLGQGASKEQRGPSIPNIFWIFFVLAGVQALLEKKTLESGFETEGVRKEEVFPFRSSALKKMSIQEDEEIVWPEATIRFSKSWKSDIQLDWWACFLKMQVIRAKLKAPGEPRPCFLKLSNLPFSMKVGALQKVLVDLFRFLEARLGWRVLGESEAPGISLDLGEQGELGDSFLRFFFIGRDAVEKDWDFEKTKGEVYLSCGAWFLLPLRCRWLMVLLIFSRWHDESLAHCNSPWHDRAASRYPKTFLESEFTLKLRAQALETIRARGEKTSFKDVFGKENRSLCKGPSGANCVVEPYPKPYKTLKQSDSTASTPAIYDDCPGGIYGASLHTRHQRVFGQGRWTGSCRKGREAAKWRVQTWWFWAFFLNVFLKFVFPPYFCFFLLWCLVVFEGFFSKISWCLLLWKIAFNGFCMDWTVVSRGFNPTGCKKNRGSVRPIVVKLPLPFRKYGVSLEIVKSL